MNPGIAARLIEINHEFYTRFGDSFSATRHRIQPGVQRVLASLTGDEAILDLGCGNGELARELAKRGHRGPYLGVDFSPPLLRDAGSQRTGFSAAFKEIDLTQLTVLDHQSLTTGHWSLITAFAVLHHIPSIDIRLNILHTVRSVIADDGRFILSNWQFLNSDKLRGRIRPWEEAAIKPSDVDAGDHLLDWRSGGAGLRYVHHFDEEELAALARDTGFIIRESFYSDGATGNLGLYQVWEPNSAP